VISFKRLALTDFTVDIPRLAKKSVLAKAVQEAGESPRQVLQADAGSGGFRAVVGCTCLRPAMPANSRCSSAALVSGGLACSIVEALEQQDEWHREALRCRLAG
jgi:hypothetical protein